MDTIAFASIKELQGKILSKEISEKELLDFFLQRFAEHDGTIKSALEVFQAYNNEGVNVDTKSLLRGIPGILKDNISQSGRKLTCASKILENFVATYDATVSCRSPIV
jgi:aspartyl-tRNA(Asn)/glutamyl-tRNA(Gln) amidotransferase subunit A